MGEGEGDMKYVHPPRVCAAGGAGSRRVPELNGERGQFSG